MCIGVFFRIAPCSFKIVIFLQFHCDVCGLRQVFEWLLAKSLQPTDDVAKEAEEDKKEKKEKELILFIYLFFV